jgi:small subunit ribosomal protein S21
LTLTTQAQSKPFAGTLRKDLFANFTTALNFRYLAEALTSKVFVLGQEIMADRNDDSSRSNQKRREGRPRDMSSDNIGQDSEYTKSASSAQSQMDKPRGGAMEVVVEHSIEKAMKILKRKLIKEGLFKELKSRRYYEKPSERKKRKLKESLKKIRKEEARSKKNLLM